jgi:WD40 repeat protein
LIGGFPSSTVRVWDLERSGGRQIRDLVFSTRKEKSTSFSGCLKGIIGAVNFWNSETVLAGTYSGMIGMYDIRDKDKGFLLGGEKKISACVQIEPLVSRNLIITGHRNSEKSLLMWDIRKPDEPVRIVNRKFRNQQRSTFAIHNDRFICYGDDEGTLSLIDLDIHEDKESLKNDCHVVVSNTPVCAVEIFSDSGKFLVATGQRQFQNISTDDDDEKEMVDCYLEVKETAPCHMIHMFELVGDC